MKTPSLVVDLKLNSAAQFWDFVSSKRRASFVNIGTNVLANMDYYDFQRALPALYDRLDLGFTCRNRFSEEGNPKAQCTLLNFWRNMMQNGFTDSYDAIDTWLKPFKNGDIGLAGHLAENLDYILTTDAPKKLTDFDPYRVYAHAMGTHPLQPFWLLRDLVKAGVTRIVEPMASTGEFTWYAAHYFPKLEYHLIDIDKKAAKLFKSRWSTVTEKEQTVMMYHNDDALTSGFWAEEHQGKTVAFIGKQSFNYFSPEQLRQLILNIREVCDYVIFEGIYYTSEHTKVYYEELEAPHLRSTPFQLCLRSHGLRPSNPILFTNHFYMNVEKKGRRGQILGTRHLFEYDWYLYTTPEIIHMFQSVNPDLTVKAWNDTNLRFEGTNRVSELDDPEILLTL